MSNEMPAVKWGGHINSQRGRKPRDTKALRAFGQRVEAALKLRGWRPATLAHKLSELGIKTERNQAASWARGVTYPSGIAAGILPAVLRVSAAQLYLGKEMLDGAPGGTDELGILSASIRGREDGENDDASDLEPVEAPLLAKWMQDHWGYIAARRELAGEKLLDLLEKEATWFRENKYWDSYKATNKLIEKVIDYLEKRRIKLEK